MSGLSELAVILIVGTAVLAARRLPDLARSAGTSARVLKAESRALKQDGSGAAPTADPKIIRGGTVPPGNASNDGTGKP